MAHPNGERDKLSDEQYGILLVFRTALRRYLHWSAQEAARLGLTSQQHQLLLAVRAHPGAAPPSIGELARYLLIRHHSAVELANRVEHAGLVSRAMDPHDQRVVRLQLTERGREIIEQLSEAHMAELQRVAMELHISQDFLATLSSEFNEDVVLGLHSSPSAG